MADWTNIPDSNLEPGKPARSVDALALRDNVKAMGIGATGAPLMVGNTVAVIERTSSGSVNLSPYKGAENGNDLFAIMKMWGAGGAGSVSGGSADRWGGGGGAYMEIICRLADLPNSLSVEVGEGGEGEVTTDGEKGGDTYVTIGGEDYGARGGYGGTDSSTVFAGRLAAGFVFKGDTILEGAGLPWNGGRGGEPNQSGKESLFGGGGGAGAGSGSGNIDGGKSFFAGTGGQGTRDAETDQEDRHGEFPGGGGGCHSSGTSLPAGSGADGFFVMYIVTAAAESRKGMF